MTVKWLDDPEDHDYGAVADYLSMLAEPASVAKTLYRKAKDILRAAQQSLLPDTNVRVRVDLGKISDGKRLSPTLLVRGNAVMASPPQIADGYHRVCASYLTDENTPIPCRLVSWQA
ncbi:MAG: hypothetical protein QOD39_3588 [Mycobacterium sp.]|jgi:hypothetical protein|nr:hypothetical protein [Mycobacterium sp.]